MALGYVDMARKNMGAICCHDCAPSKLTRLTGEMVKNHLPNTPWEVYMPISWGGLGGQCKHIWHTWSVWVLKPCKFVSRIF